MTWARAPLARAPPAPTPRRAQILISSSGVMGPGEAGLQPSGALADAFRVASYRVSGLRLAYHG